MRSLFPAERVAPAALALLAVVGAFPVVRSLIVPDLNWCYPYMSSDSYDWIANGLYWLGAPVASNWRPPGLPVVIGVLWKIGALSLLPVVNFLVVGVTTAVLYLLLRERFTPLVSALAAWIFFSNDYVQDLTKYLLAEIYCTLFIVLAARAFYRAAKEPKYYVRFAVWLGVGFFFHHAALIAGIGFAVALLLTRREHLRQRAPWQALALSAALAGTWVLARWMHYHRNPDAPQHPQEALLYVSTENVRLYLVAGLALLGLALLPLYGAGLLKTAVGNPPEDRAFRATVFGPLLSLAIFWVFFYDWADKRFLYYLFPFCVCLLAAGVALLLSWARRSVFAKSLAAAYLAAAVLWNQIHYPSYGINLLALTPRDFLKFPAESKYGTAKMILHVRGAQVVRLNETFAASLSGSLFDFRGWRAMCDLNAPLYSCLAAVEKHLQGSLPPESAIGLGRVDGLSDDFYANHNRIGNELLRKVVRPEAAGLVLTSDAGPADTSEFACGPYRVVREKP